MHIGTYSAAPAADFAAVGVMCTARCRGSTTASTPAPSHERKIAPRLPGSVTPSMATKNGLRVGEAFFKMSPISISGIPAAVAMIPCGASLRASRSMSLRGTYRTGTR